MREKDDWRLTEIVSHDLGAGDPFAAAIRGTRMPMVITNPRLPDNPIVFANEAFQNLTGYERDEVLGRNCRFLQGPLTDPNAVYAVGQAVAKQDSINVDLLNYRKDGSTFWNALYVSPVRSEDGVVRFYFASQLDVTERIEAQEEIARRKAEVEEQVRLRTADLQAALEAKTTLLHEVDHRVKNNLTMIGSLLRLQSRSITDVKLRETLENMLSRVDALATVHRRLYQTEDVSRFDIGTFADGLVRDVVMASGREDVQVSTDVEPIEVPANQAAPVGLILNELVTNAVKHAFSDDRSGTIHFTARAYDGRIQLELRDDGVGFDDSLVTPSSIGRSLVARLSRQIGAETRWESRPGGTRVVVAFPLVQGG